MRNPKTTLAGYALALGSLATIIGHALGGGLSLADLQALAGILGGLGLIGASDGGP